MNFREFFLLNENRFYYAYLDQNGDYSVNSHFFDTPMERDTELTQVKLQDKPIKTWKFTIKPGDYKINIPGANENEERGIRLAYYARMGLTTPYSPDSINPDIDGSIIAPQDFDKDYWKKVALKFKPKTGTTPSPEDTADY